MKDIKDISYRKKLVDYLRRNLSKGYNADSLKWALVSQGYTRTDVDRAIIEVQKELEETSKKNIADKEKPKITYEIYDKNNNPIRISTRNPFAIKEFFRKFRNFFS
ncbi:hypothetical protein J4407_00145 [Candidatus Pacearchaeota archaeon]|nr:hypothetical protein [Candidatus Pacearchaeota archaeon]